jgi:hypothetical protein
MMPESVKTPEPVNTPISNRYAALDDASNGAADSHASQHEAAGEAMLRRRARRLALLLMTASAIFMIALALGAWFLLRG